MTLPGKDDMMAPDYYANLTAFLEGRNMYHQELHTAILNKHSNDEENW